jgi:hypothetical protein
MGNPDASSLRCVNRAAAGFVQGDRMNDFCLQSAFNSARVLAGFSSSSRRDEGRIAQGNPAFAAANEGAALGKRALYRSSPVGAVRNPIRPFEVLHAIACSFRFPETPRRETQLKSSQFRATSLLVA